MPGPADKNFYSVSEQLDPEIYKAFKLALQTGKWPDGRVMNEEQRALVMESIIVYEAANVPPDQRVGHIDGRCPGDSASPDADTQTIKTPH